MSELTDRIAQAQPGGVVWLSPAEWAALRHAGAVQWADPESAEDWGDADTPRNDPARYWKVAELPAPSWAVVRWLRRQAAKAARQEPPPAAAKPADPPKSPARIRIVEDRAPRFGAAGWQDLP